MMTKGIRGATTVDENTPHAIKEATVELFRNIIEENSITEKQVSHVVFTATKDLNAAYPAKFIRSELNWNNTAMVCLPELEIEQALTKCIRVMVVVNCPDNFTPRYVYLRGAKNLRS